MIYTKFPYNPIIEDMTYNGEELVISFKKPKYKRSYNASKELAYKLFYSKTAADCLKNFNQIKKLCTVINVKHI